MASSNKRKTTMANLNGERRLTERRLEKQTRRAARNQAATHEEAAGPSPAHEAAQPLANQPAVDAATEAFADMARTDARKHNRA
jgi:hypothetical protein